MQLDQIVNLKSYPLDDPGLTAICRHALETRGVVTMPGFVGPAAIAAMVREGREHQHKAFAQTSRHTVYLSPPDPDLDDDHPRNHLVTSSKGCITDDQIPKASPLRVLYDAPAFRRFLCAVLDEPELHAYGDPQSSINLHYARTGQELGWHFDNSSFAITLMVQAPERGGTFEFVENVRDADAGEMNFDLVADVLDGRVAVRQLDAKPGTLVVFRGRNSLHRVTPNEGERTRMLAVLAYNSQPGIALSESARMTFYGRIA